MNQAVLVNKVRQSSIQHTSSDCRLCPSEGLPILPVRYAAARNTLPGFALPSACGDGVTAIGLKYHKYVLRTMRPGFIYLHYNRSGAWTTQCFMVEPGGSFREIPLSTNGPIVPENKACASSYHGTNSSFISIQKPEQASVAYVAYSEEFWSRQIVAGYVKKHQLRMQKFSPATLASGGEQPHTCKIAGVATTVVDYGPANSDAHLKNDYFEYRSRADHAASLIKRMDSVSPAKGVVLAVWDPIGITSDLNSHRLHALNELQEYLKNNAWKKHTATSIQGLREYVAQQAREELKNAKSTRHGRGGAYVVSKEQQIKQKTEEGFKRFEAHYDETARIKFVKQFDESCEKYKANIKKWDEDYVKWIGSEPLKIAMSDYNDPMEPNYALLGVVPRERILNGGVLSEASLGFWKEQALLDPSDVGQYAVSGILANQQDWAEAFKNANEKTVGALFIDKRDKLYDGFKNTAESRQLEHGTQRMNAIVNNTIPALFHTTSGALAIATTAVAKQSGKIVEQIQLKLGLAYASAIARTNAVLIKMEMTLDEWHTSALSVLFRSQQKFDRNSSQGLAAMALNAQLRLPATVADKIITISFWLTGSIQEITAAVETLGGKVVSTGTQAATATVKAIGTAVKGADATVGAATRAVSVVTHNMKNFAVSVPARVAASLVGRAATGFTRNALTVAGSTDVRLATLAVGFQAWALRDAIESYQENIGFAQRDAALSVTSAEIGLTGAVVEAGAKGWMKIAGQQAAVSAFGWRVAAATVAKNAGYLGAAASFLDAIQASIKAYSLAKKGDSDASGFQIGIAATAGIAVVASVYIIGGNLSLFGPVGVLLACIAIGLTLTYYALLAEDTPVVIWLDRCSFGKGKRSEGKFGSLIQERDALELVGKQLVVEVEWNDVPLNFTHRTDEISLVIKRPGGLNDAMEYGMLVDGPAGLRLAFVTQDGTVPAERTAAPSAYLAALKLDARKGTIGYEGGVLTASLNNIDKDGKKILQREDRVEIDPDKFNKAKVWVRYYPNKDNGYFFYEDELLVAD